MTSDGGERRIAIGSDHAAFAPKKNLIAWLESERWIVEDFGAYSEERTDYPDIAKPVCEAVLSGRVQFGVLLCGTGLGMSYAANRFPGIRGALCWSKEVAVLARTHNNANVLVMPGRHPSIDPLQDILETFLASPFSEESRHVRRIEKIDGEC